MDMLMPMAASTPGTATAMAAAPTVNPDYVGPEGHKCKISMLFNFHTIDACFFTNKWQITSNGMFAGSCIGVILLTMALEALRRAVKDYDRYLIRSHAASQLAANPISNPPPANLKGPAGAAAVVVPPEHVLQAGQFRPSVLQQAARALLHMLQFATAYFVMLLAMYYNVYFLICIFIGAFLGAFVFQWEKLGGRPATSAAGEATICCG